MNETDIEKLFGLQKLQDGSLNFEQWHGEDKECPNDEYLSSLTSKFFIYENVDFKNADSPHFRLCLETLS